MEKLFNILAIICFVALAIGIVVVIVACYMKQVINNKNMSDKKKNTIVTATIAVIVAAIATCCSINFVKHTNTEVKYVIRDGMFEIQHISDYSPTIKGTEGDAAIYKNFGKKNTVLLTKKDYVTLKDVEKDNIVIDKERFSYEPFENGAAMLMSVTCLSQISSNSGVSGVFDGSYDGFLTSYETALNAVKKYPALKISSLEVELLPKMLVLGGTHPYEANGFLTATMFLENIDTERGVFFIVNETNRAGFNYEQENEARQQTFEVPLKDLNGNVIGSRTFKIGSRFAHLTAQWPTPDVYMHSSGQQMTNTEARNLNRVYPGDANGNFTERVAYGITQLVKENNITLVVDLHEASPEYLTNDAIVHHQDTAELATYMWRNGLRYQETGKERPTRIDITVEESPQNMHGLTHRELGDFTNAFVMLCESSDAYEGRLHGALTKDLITYYDHNDKFYEYINNMSQEERSKYVDYWYSPDSIDVRCARHTLAIYSMIDAYNNCGASQRTTYTCSLIPEEERHSTSGQNYTGKLIVNNIPTYENIVKYSLGAYLLPVE